jgi:hypothetical protein
MSAISQDSGGQREVTELDVLARYWKEIILFAVLVSVVVFVVAGGGFALGYLFGQHGAPVGHSPTSAQDYSDVLWGILVFGVSIALVFHGLPFQFKSIHNTEVVLEDKEDD